MTTAPGAPDAIDRYLEELRRWGARINLVGSTRPEALGVHVEDALAAASHLPRGARVADLGSGAGLPGVPIAIARPDLRLTLVESRERRVHFLRHVVRELDLACAVERRRLESGPDEPFDLALARAVAPAPGVLDLARPWIRPGGELWLWTREDPAGLDWELEATIPLPEPRGAIQRLRAPIARGTR